MSRGFATNYRMTLLAASVLACFVGVAGRLVMLHVVERDDLLRHVEKARRQIVVEHARRGAIVDARGNVLATSRSFVILGADPEIMRKEDEARWPELARLIGVPLPELERTLRAGIAASNTAAAGDKERRVRWVKLADEVDEDVYDRVRDLGIRGIYGNRDYRRVYPSGRLASHLLGFVNREGSPVTGVELHFDFYLKGQDGWIESEKDGARRELAQFRTRDVPAQDGHSVVLTIDSVIQHIIEKELQAIATTYKPRFATVIASDPHTGEILGLANYPTFDPNQFNLAPMEALRNYAVTDIIEPGSTFKIVPAAAALNEGVVTSRTTIDCEKPVATYKGREVKLMKDDHPFGVLSVSEIMSHSSNRGAAHLGIRVGDARLHDYAKRFGFGEPTGFPLGGEVRGILDEPRKWDGLTITRMPAGHAVAATPIQIHYAMGAVASGGVLLRPQIVKEIRDARGEVVKTFAPEERGKVMAPSTAASIAQMLRKVVSPDGTAAETQIEGFELAGKTGTTQKIVDGRYVNNRHVASFVGFFPAANPRVVLSVIVDDARVPGGTAYGRAVAAPSFRRIAEQLIQYLDIKPVVTSNRNLLAAKGGGW